MEPKPKVLCVDDEPNVLEGLSLQLRRLYDVTTATSGPLGLAALAERGPFAVVLSDMRMPQMDGATFLAAVRKDWPESVRMLLTGHADLASATAAVNDGQIFRFLTKPCPPETLRQAFAAAVDQHRLIVAERELLERTLRGSVKALTDVLAAGSPLAFGRSARIWTLVQAVARVLELRTSWELEMATKLAELGLVIVPEATLDRYFLGAALTPEERVIVGRVPAATQEILSHIPRLETVRALIAYYHCADPGRALQDLPASFVHVAQVLRVSVDFERLEASGGLPPDEAIAALRSRTGHFHPVVLDALARAHLLRGAGPERAVSLHALRPGMVLLEDVRSARGLILVARGNELTFSTVERLQNLSGTGVHEPIRVVEPLSAAPGA